jgi:hypothetical protein
MPLWQRLVNVNDCNNTDSIPSENPMNAHALQVLLAFAEVWGKDFTPVVPTLSHKSTHHTYLFNIHSNRWSKNFPKIKKVPPNTWHQKSEMKQAPFCRPKVEWRVNFWRFLLGVWELIIFFYTGGNPVINTLKTLGATVGHFVALGAWCPGPTHPFSNINFPLSLDFSNDLSFQKKQLNVLFFMSPMICNGMPI